ncbi:TBC domain-containing protein C4G8.04 [Daldinia childiae]|uniref:TBC domain-containing protein C4G8.04 n=1 Tax=Daldinia childiae TaxID=326645 RepID=UPI001444A795|nr:TBC domain-containing protein C4G8.04 [Daldinia childiae]KAF3070825.1 TBC domain-containing protein C4G8.04 [Daldinia childiae]
MDPESNAPLERSTSQLSAASTSAKMSRSHSTRAKSKPRKLISQPSSSASSIAASDKSLTSFPSFSPQSPRDEPSFTTFESNTSTVNVDRKPLVAPIRTSMVESLTSAEAQKTARDALFDDAPITAYKIPGALHHASDDHIQYLIAKHGAINLVRQVAEDLAHRDMEISRLRRRADERERALRKIIRGCGLSSLDLETKLRSVETELQAQEKIKYATNGDVSGMMNDAIHDSMSYKALGITDIDDSTVRANALSAPRDSNTVSKGTMKAWKEYLWGGGSRKASRAASINEEGVKTAIRASTPGDRRPPIQEDLFTPPDVESAQSSSRASSIYSAYTNRKPSSSFASMALQLVVGKGSSIRDSESTRGRSNSAGQGGSMRSSSNASTRTGASNRAASTQGGPKALMSMRRATPKPGNLQFSRPRERWESIGANPESPSATRSDNNGPVEMDTIFSPEGQPPALSQLYNNYNSGEYLIDRFGFIYDQRRKKRQREAAKVASRMKNGHEMLSSGRSNLSPNLLDDDASSSGDAKSDDRPESPTSIEGLIDQSKAKRWQDYLKIATFPTELLSHTPSITAPNIEVLEGSGSKSPGLINTDDRGFVPTATTTTAALDRETSPAKSDEESATATLVHEDVEPVKLLLKQLSDVHDTLQREKSVRWNEFLRKVRAERRREGEAAAATAAAAAEARFQTAPVMIPEAKLTDGETIGIADLGVKGKVGRAKWNEFRNLVLGGIPVANRPKIWAECSGAISKRTPGYYRDLISRPSSLDDDVVISQIEMDINRTLTDNIFFRKGPGVTKLNEVLRAYARHNPEVGYCQGMNLIAANLLLIMPSTEDAFWVFVSIIERILPQGYYDHSLMASRADQHVLRQYVSQVLPKLSQHLDALSIELEALTFQWFLSVFTDCLSAEALFRVWDVVLCINDGSTFLFQVALALLKLNERQLLQCDAPAAVYTYINHQMTNHAISIDGLIQASEGLRRVVRREDVEERRNKAIEADKQMVREREERNAKRRAEQNSQKSTSVPTLMAESSASAVPSLTLQAESESSSVTGLNILDAVGEEAEEEGTGPARTPAEEETSFGLG